MAQLIKAEDVNLDMLKKELNKMVPKDSKENQAAEELSNWIFLEFMLQDKVPTQAKKLLSPNDYRYRFMFEMASQVTCADAKRKMGSLFKKATTFTIVDKTTDALVMYGLELSLASEKELVMFLEWVFDHSLCSRRFPREIISKKDESCHLRALSKLYLLSHYVLIATEYGRLKDPSRLNSKLVANLQLIATNLFAPWKELTASELRIKTNLEINLEILWVYLEINRYVGEFINFPNGVESIVKTMSLVVENVSSYFSTEVDLNIFETVRFMGHTLLLSLFCEKEMNKCPFPKNKIKNKDVAIVDADAVEVEDGTKSRAMRSNSLPLVPPLKNQTRKRKRRQEGGTNTKKKKPQPASEGSPGATDAVIKTQPSNNQSPVPGTGASPPTPAFALTESSQPSTNPSKIAVPGASSPSPAFARVCCICVLEQCAPAVCACALGNNPCENCEPDGFICKNPRGSHKGLLKKRKEVSQEVQVKPMVPESKPMVSEPVPELIKLKELLEIQNTRYGKLEEALGTLTKEKEQEKEKQREIEEKKRKDDEEKKLREKWEQEKQLEEQKKTLSSPEKRRAQVVVDRPQVLVDAGELVQALQGKKTAHYSSLYPQHYTQPRMLPQVPPALYWPNGGTEHQ